MNAQVDDDLVLISTELAEQVALEAFEATLTQMADEDAESHFSLWYDSKEIDQFIPGKSGWDFKNVILNLLLINIFR